MIVSMLSPSGTGLSNAFSGPVHPQREPSSTSALSSTHDAIRGTGENI